MKTDALVILSGGQDSTTCTAIAARTHNKVHAITFDYGQRHAVELDAAKAVAAALNLATHDIIPLGRVLVGSSPLVSANPLGQYESAESLPGGIEPTFVPGRNALFMTIAANRAAALNIRDIYIGVCEEDYGGYPDCRDVFIQQMQIALGEAIAGNPYYFRFHRPLMFLSKAQSVTLAADVLGPQFDEVMGLTHTCYAGVPGGCGKCHACILRDTGFRQAGIADPLWKLREA